MLMKMFYIYTKHQKMVLIKSKYPVLNGILLNYLQMIELFVPRTGGYNLNSVAHISGEVNLPGTFPIISGKTSAYDLMELAEGTTSDALLSAAYLIRGSGIENQVSE